MHQNDQSLIIMHCNDGSLGNFLFNQFFPVSFILDGLSHLCLATKIIGLIERKAWRIGGKCCRCVEKQFHHVINNVVVASWQSREEWSTRGDIESTAL